MGLTLNYPRDENESDNKRQVGGSHYEEMPVQPSPFARMNDYDCDAFSILKYLSRHKAKNGKQDLLKARSFVRIRIDNNRTLAPIRPRFTSMTMISFCEANKLDIMTSAALYALHDWVRDGTVEGFAPQYLYDQIDNLIAQYPD